MNAIIRMLWFHMRTLWSTSFFLETAIASPLSFFFIKLIALQANMSDTVLFESCVSGLWATTTLAVGIIGFQRFQGVLQYLAVSVLPTWKVFLPLVSAAALIGIIAVPVCTVPTAIVRAVRGQTVLEINYAHIVGYVLALMACVSSALLLSAIFMLSRHAIAFEPLILVPVWLLSGIVIPVDQFPVLMRWLAFAHPLTSAVWVAQHGFADDVAYLVVLWCVILSAVYMCTAGWGLRVALRKATREGSVSLA